MIPHRIKRVLQAGKYSGVVMLHGRCLAVHQTRRGSNFPSERRSDALVAKADSQYRNRRAEFLNNAITNAGRLRSPWAGRQANPLGSKRVDCVDGNLIVSLHHDIATQLTKILDEVVRE